MHDTELDTFSTGYVCKLPLNCGDLLVVISSQNRLQFQCRKHLLSTAVKSLRAQKQLYSLVSGSLLEI